MNKKNNEKANDTENGNVERLLIKLPKGEKARWKELSKNAGHSYPRDFLSELVRKYEENKDFTPTSIEKISNLEATNELLAKKIELLVDKIIILEKTVMNKTILSESISDNLTNKILSFIKEGKASKELAQHLKLDEIIILGLLNDLQVKRKVEYNIEDGLWKTIE